jgi:hypothetical protein
MAQAQERDLAEVVGQRVDIEPAERLELGVRGSAGADEVRVVGIREAVRVGARRCEHRLLLEAEDEIDGSGGYEHVGNRLRPLGVGGRMRDALVHVQLGA